MRGWERMQGFVFRPGDERFEGRSAQEALKTMLVGFVRTDGQPQCRRRHPRADRQVARRSAAARLRQPAEVAQRGGGRIAQGRADWGLAIEPVAKLYGLGFLPVAPEHYDFLLVESRKERPAVQEFLAALHDPATRERIRALGMRPADG